MPADTKTAAIPLINYFPRGSLTLAIAVSAVLFGAPSQAASPLTPTTTVADAPFLATPTLATPARTASASISRLSDALQQAQQEQLASHRAWQRLLYYPEPSPSFTTTGQTHPSRVVNRFNPLSQQQQFFIHPAGATNPQAELDSLLTALFNPTDTGNGAAQCRFPARSQWLINTLGIDRAALPKVDCSDLGAWLNKIQPASVSVIFASEYLDNPASAFAHSFLRFDNPDINNQYYLNFTPKVTDGEPFAKFAYKSSIGGNAGEFTMTNYAKGIADYVQRDGRDVWQYQLNLSDAQVQQLAYQTWEIKDQILPYYLLKDNCASEILVLLNGLFPQKNYLANNSPMVSPAQVVRLLQKEGLISTTAFTPSKYTSRQAYLNQPHVYDDKAATEPLSSNTVANLTNRGNPALANPLSRFDIGTHHQSANHTDNTTQTSHHALTLNYRLVYHDALDKTEGYPIGNQLTALSASISLSDSDRLDKLQLQQLGLFDVRVLHPINSAQKGNSWGANVGLQRVFDGIRTDARDHLVTNVSAALGKSYALGQPHDPHQLGELPANICYGMTSLAAQFGKGIYHGYRTGLGINLGCMAELNPDWRTTAELKLPYWLSGDSTSERYWQPKLDIGTQYDINRHHAIRVTASREWLPNSAHSKHLDEVTLKWLHYFE